MKWSDFYTWLNQNGCVITDYNHIYHRNGDYITTVDTLVDSDSGEIEQSIIIITEYIRNYKLDELLD